MIHARPTTYNGIRMRSRLEASFAERLDAVGAPWQYEPQCFASPEGQYLPDFLTGGAYVEVKPTVADFGAALHKMHIILASEPDATLHVATSPAIGQWDTRGTCSPCPLCSTCRCDRTRDICRQHREEQPTPIREGAAAAARRQLAERNRTPIGRRCDGCDRPATQASPVEDFDLYLCNECSAKNTAAQERRRRIGEQYQCDRCPNPATNVTEDGDGDLALCDIHAWQASTDGTLAP